MDNYTKYSILIITLFSIAVLSLASIYHVSGDGCWHIPVGKFIANNFKIPLFEPLGRDEPFWSPPLYHFLVAIVYSVFSALGDNAANFAVKFISPIFGILSLVFSFLAIKKLYNSKIAFYSAIFLAFIPIFIDYSVLSYVESTLVFFIVLSVYFLVNGKLVLSGISAGLSILTKYNGIFILPVLLYILHKKFGKNTFKKRALVILVIPLLVALPWLIRNWILLGNPIWPFLNFAFNGLEAKSYSALEFGRLLHYNTLAFIYLGIFGVPDGNYSAFSFLDTPYFSFLFPIWAAGTFIFIMPLFFGFRAKKGDEKKILSFWIISYLLLFFLYIINVGWAVSRMLLPALPAVAAFWAFGLEKLQKGKLKSILAILLIAIAAGLVFTSFVKFSIASIQWSFYKEDFDWIKANTNPDSIFIANGQCVPYSIERTSLYSNEESLKRADYVWINQNFKLDRISILDDSALKSLQSKNYRIAYSNKETGTVIYSTQ